MTRPRAPWSSNFTRPPIFANSVSSLPRPTFRPGRKRRPRCRTRIDPPVTTLPSNRLTPSRCELLSRPLRDDPCPFFVAIALHLNVGDADARQQGSMTLGPTVLLAPLLLEDANLLALVELADDAEHLGAGHERRPRRDVAIVVADEQDLVEGHLAARVAGIVAVNRDDGAWLHTELA